MMRGCWHLLRDAARQWSAHNAPRLGAALAFYSILSLAPTLGLIIALCGYVFGAEAVRGQIFWQLQEIMGRDSARVVQSFLDGPHAQATGIGTHVLSLLTLLLGASGVFVELRDTLNYIWAAPPRKESGFLTLLRDRLSSFATVLGVGFLLALSIAATAIGKALNLGADVHLSTSTASFLNFVLTFFVTALLFALMFRFIPEVDVDWEDVVMGSVITALLFVVGRVLIALYLAKAGVAAGSGAAGSLVALLVWVYYSAQIFLLGAEFTNVYARYRRPAEVPTMAKELLGQPQT